MCISNYMIGRAIWDKLPMCIFENMKLPEQDEGNFKIFKSHEGAYWLITPNQQTLCIETVIF